MEEDYTNPINYIDLYTSVNDYFNFSSNVSEKRSKDRLIYNDIVNYNGEEIYFYDYSIRGNNYTVRVSKPIDGVLIRKDSESYVYETSDTFWSNTVAFKYGLVDKPNLDCGVLGR